MSQELSQEVQDTLKQAGLIRFYAAVLQATPAAVFIAAVQLAKARGMNRQVTMQAVIRLWWYADVIEDPPPKRERAKESNV